MRLVDADAFAMYLQLVCKGNDMSAEKKVFSANGIIHMLQDMPTASDMKWTPMSEKEPEHDHPVLVSTVDTVDAKPVRHGHWVRKGLLYHCSACSYGAFKGDFVFGARYCPICGARMDERTEECRGE